MIRRSSRSYTTAAANTVFLSPENAPSAPATNRGSGRSGAMIIRSRIASCSAFHLRIHSLHGPSGFADAMRRDPSGECGAASAGAVEHRPDGRLCSAV
jgi:hypothetical protein